MDFFFGNSKEIIAQVNQTDLELEEARIIKERTQRKVLRLQAKAGALTSSELLDKLSGAEASPDEPLRVNPESSSEPRQQRSSSSFPLPPTSDTSKED